MANQIIVTDSGNVQVAITPTSNVQVEISRAAITTLTTVGNANYANTAGTVVNSNQPNITQVGTLANLTSSGNITAPYFIGNVVGNISGNIVVPGTNTSVLFNDAGVAGASDAFQFNKSSNTVTVNGNLSATNISGNGAGLSSITGANVSGQVSYAAVANSVSGSNVSGAVAYATTANAVAGANVSGQVAYAAVANSVAGANVSGAVAYATTANSVAGANVSGQVSYAAVANSVAVANVVGIGNIATINKDGNSGNVLYGNGVFAAVVSPTSVANANYSNFAGNVINSAQPNITSLGNLTGLVVSGDATVAGNLAVSGNLTYVNVTNLVVQDPVIEMGGGPNGAPLTTNDGKDRGSLLHYYTTQPVDAFMGWDNSNGEFGFGSNVTNSNDVMTFNTYGNVRASTFIGNLTGTASHATVADSANSVAGANVTGQVANALVAGTVYTNAQPNITSVGTLTSLAIAGNITGPDVMSFDTANGTGTLTTGQLSWDTAEQTLSLGMNNSVTQQIGLETYILIKASSAITNGQVVMFTGASGDNVQAAPANVAVAGFRAGYVLGVATQDIANNGTGYITSFGKVRGLNTNAYNVGDLLWLDPTVVGGMTATQPSAPNYQIQIATVTKKSGGDGQIQVIIRPEPQLKDISDVTITTPSAGQALVYNGSNVWINGNPNLANYAAVANSVAGANVSGEVAYAAVANSVAVANVSGIGNIATVNLDGSSSNVLYGNGQWATISIPAGDQISNGTSNVSIPVANGNIEFSTAGNANVVTIDTSGVLHATTANLTNGFGDQLIIKGLDSANSSAPPHIVFYASAGNISNPEPLTTPYGSQLYVLNGQGWNGSQYSFGGYQSMRYVGEPTSPSWFVYGEPTYNYVQPITSGPSDGNTGYFFENHTGGSLFVGAFDLDNGFSPTPYNYSFNIDLDGGSTFKTFEMTYDGNFNIAESFNGNSANITGNILAGNINGGNLVTANYFSGDGGLLSNIAVANISGIGNIATLNLDGNVSNILHGDGSWGPETETSNANYAAYAGNVTIAAQSNITSLGNLVSLTVSDSNTSNPSTQFIPTGNVVGGTTFSNSFIRIDQYNDLGNANGVQNIAFVKSRGNSTTPTAAANTDTILRLSGHVYNGNGYPKAFQISATAPLAANSSFTLANTAYTPGSFALTVGNPYGNVANSSSNTGFNNLVYNQNGTLVLLSGTNTGGTTVPSINMVQYGIAANGVGSAQIVLTQRARGNRDGNVAVADGDQIGGLGWQAYNGNAFFTTRFAQIRANVNTSHGTIANGASVPTDLQFITCSNTTGYTTLFYGNGSASFPGAVTSAGQLTVTSGNITATSGNLNVTGGNVIVNGTTASPRNFVVNNGGAIFTLDNVDTNTASFAFSTYNNANSLVNPYTFYRARGNVASPAAVQAGDTVSSIGYNVYGDTGNAYLQVASTGVNIVANDGAGNVTGDYTVTASKISLYGNVYPNNVVFTKFSETVSSPGSVSGTVTPDLANGSIFKYTLNGNVTINSLANVATGSSATIVLTQDATGGRTLTSSMLFAGGTKTLSTAAGAVDIISVFYDGSTYYATLSKGYA